MSLVLWFSRWVVQVSQSRYPSVATAIICESNKTQGHCASAITFTYEYHIFRIPYRLPESFNNDVVDLERVTEAGSSATPEVCRNLTGLDGIKRMMVMNQSSRLYTRNTESRLGY